MKQLTRPKRKLANTEEEQDEDDQGQDSEYEETDLEDLKPIKWGERVGKSVDSNWQQKSREFLRAHKKTIRNSLNTSVLARKDVIFKTIIWSMKRFYTKDFNLHTNFEALSKQEKRK